MNQLCILKWTSVGHDVLLFLYDAEFSLLICCWEFFIYDHKGYWFVFSIMSLVLLLKALRNVSFFSIFLKTLCKFSIFPQHFYCFSVFTFINFPLVFIVLPVVLDLMCSFRVEVNKLLFCFFLFLYISSYYITKKKYSF